MKRRIRISLIVIVFIVVLVNIFMYLYIKIAQGQTKSLFLKVRNNDKLYVYETYFHALNAVMYVEDLKDTSGLINYYKKLANRDSSATINFDIKTMPITMYEPIYIYNYLNNGSQIIELIDFDVNCWGYLKGYVYKPTTHVNPPPYSLIKQKEAFFDKYNKDNHVKVVNRIAKKISGYGWYCDN